MEKTIEGKYYVINVGVELEIHNVEVTESIIKTAGEIENKILENAISTSMRYVQSLEKSIEDNKVEEEFIEEEDDEVQYKNPLQKFLFKILDFFFGGDGEE